MQNTQTTAWEELWSIAADSEGDAEILINLTPWIVTLKYPDGSIGVVEYNHDTQRWEFCEPLNVYPCDVSSRDSL